MRTATWCLALVVVAFVQSPGLIARDTKVDLTADPVGLLASALRLWQPSQDFGTLQNQAYGYLWPMGPFFALGHLAGLPGWVVQRGWWALLLVAAFLGFRRLADALGIGTPGSRTLAALAFALAPRVLTTMGAISSEALPLCLAPWVLLPLVRGAREGSERRAALASGLALLCIGGVNAVATLWVLPLGALWLLTRQPGPRRRRLAGWWSVAVVAATAWWLVPLLLLGRYSPPFLDYIETAATTTARTSLVEVLRGTSHWVAYLGGFGDPEWRAGWLLVSVPLLVLQTGMVAALGLVGLARTDLPHRRFLLLTALVGLLGLTAGHLGPLTGLQNPAVRDLLDGALAPLRNLHKADVLLRLPLALGLCHLAGRVRLPVTLMGGRRPDLLRVVAVAVVIGSSAPALAGVLVPNGAYTAIPSSWRKAAAWLDAQPGQERALVVPGASFADQAWGRTQDEVLQPLTNARWAVRDAVPLAPPGVVRLMDAVEARLVEGRGSPGLAPLLARAGVGYVVVRNDLDLVRTKAPSPVLVHQALAESPGFTRVAAFGDPVGGLRTLDGTVLDDFLQLPYPAVEVFRVAGADGPVTVLPADGALTVSGGPEALLDLADVGLLEGRAAILAGDPALAPPGPGAAADGVGVVTDSLRRVERDYGTIRDATSPTLAAGEALRLDRVAPDLLPVRADGHLTVAGYSGIDGVSASSSASDVDALFFRSPTRLPWAALDDDPDTAWLTGQDGPVGAWWQVRLSEPRDLTEIDLAFATGVGGAPTSVRLSTDQGSRVVVVRPDGALQRLRTPAGSTRTLRVTVLAVSSPTASVVGLAQVRLPGVAPVRRLVTPADLTSPDPAVVLLDAVPGHRAGCARQDSRPLCSPSLPRRAETDSDLRRQVSLPAAGGYDATLTARPMPGPALDALLTADAQAAVTASSQQLPDAVAGPAAVLDGDPETGWVAAPGDATPTLRVAFVSPRTVTGVRVLLDDYLAASRPTAVRVSAGGVTRTATLDATGRATFAAVEGAEVEVAFSGVTPVGGLDRGGAVRVLPVGVSELALVGAEDTSVGKPVITLPCGSGPTLTVDSTVIQTRASATRAALLRGDPVPLELCSNVPLTMAAGTHTMDAVASAALAPTRLLLTPRAGSATVAPPAPRTVHVERFDAAHRTVQVGPGARPALLAVRENANPGWEASLGGVVLTPVRLDGWQQGWWVPAGAGGTVTLRYTPEGSYRVALLVGLVLAVALLVGALLPVRRTAAPLRAALGERAVPVRALLGLGIVGLGGPAAAALLALVWVVALALRRWVRPETSGAVLAGSGMLVAAALVALDPAPGPASQGVAAQALCLISLSGLTLRSRFQRTAVRRRRLGRSSSQRLAVDTASERGRRTAATSSA